MPHNRPVALESDDISAEIAGLLRATACAKLQALAERPDLGPLLLAFCRRVAGDDDLTKLQPAELDRLADILIRWLDAEREAGHLRLVI